MTEGSAGAVLVAMLSIWFAAITLLTTLHDRAWRPHIADMVRLGSWIEPFPEGIYVAPADAWIDPSQPKPRALVTHGHADHARGGHGQVWATPETLAIMECRYGPQQGAP